MELLMKNNRSLYLNTQQEMVEAQPMLYAVFLLEEINPSLMCVQGSSLGMQQFLSKSVNSG